MPRTAAWPLPAATEALTAKVTLSLGCAVVDPAALGDRAGRGGEALQVQVLRVRRERRRGGGRIVRVVRGLRQVARLPRGEERRGDLLPVLLRRWTRSGSCRTSGVPLPGLKTVSTSTRATTSTASTPGGHHHARPCAASPAAAAAPRRARRTRRSCGRRAAAVRRCEWGRSRRQAPARAGARSRDAGPGGRGPSGGSRLAVPAWPARCRPARRPPAAVPGAAAGGSRGSPCVAWLAGFRRLHRQPWAVPSEVLTRSERCPAHQMSPTGQVNWCRWSRSSPN